MESTRGSDVPSEFESGSGASPEKGVVVGPDETPKPQGNLDETSKPQEVSIESVKRLATMDLLRFSTAGSVDDGKSTLIGRLMYDTKSIFEDQMDAIQVASKRLGEGEVNLALLTDGLRAEREQKITIDVAYRYFATPKRKFIIADTPGHTQYTRNMVTGASTSELAIILIDARKGVLTQSKRHSIIASLLQIPHLIVAINKMDLMDFREDVFEEIVADYQEFAGRLEIDDVTFIPISALLGDNIVDRSTNMPWYTGPTLLHHLEHVPVGSRRNLKDLRFPVQMVIRPNQDFRGFAGRVASGIIRKGDEILALPSNRVSKVTGIHFGEEELNEAQAGDSVTVTLADEIDISRGDMLVRPENVPQIEQAFDALLCWMGDEPMKADTPYLLMHTQRLTQAFITSVDYKIDVDSLHRVEPTSPTQMNEIGRVKIQTAKPIFFDPHTVNQDTGSFILIEPGTNVTVGAGMIRGASTVAVKPTSSPNVVWQPLNVPREEREARNGHKGAVIWLTGLSGSGKSTIGRELEKRLFAEGRQSMLLDGDHLRHGLNADLGFSPADREENIRRVAHVAHLFFEQGALTICTFVSPFAKDRDFARSLVPEGQFLEVHIAASVDECRKRDPKGIYKAADEGKVKELTGVTSPYEVPEHAEVVLPTAELDVDACVDRLIQVLVDRGLIPA